MAAAVSFEAADVEPVELEADSAFAGVALADPNKGPLSPPVIFM